MIHPVVIRNRFNPCSTEAHGGRHIFIRLRHRSADCICDRQESSFLLIRLTTARLRRIPIRTIKNFEFFFWESFLFCDHEMWCYGSFRVGSETLAASSPSIAGSMIDRALRNSVRVVASSRSFIAL